jgi:hypothetical protein
MTPTVPKLVGRCFVTQAEVFCGDVVELSSRESLLTALPGDVDSDGGDRTSLTRRQKSVSRASSSRPLGLADTSRTSIRRRSAHCRRPGTVLVKFVGRPGTVLVKFSRIYHVG